MDFDKLLNNFPARTMGRTAYTIFSILESDPNTTEQDLLAVLESVFGPEARSGWCDQKLNYHLPVLQRREVVC